MINDIDKSTICDALSTNGFLLVDSNNLSYIACKYVMGATGPKIFQVFAYSDTECDGCHYLSAKYYSKGNNILSNHSVMFTSGCDLGTMTQAFMNACMSTIYKSYAVSLYLDTHNIEVGEP